MKITILCNNSVSTFASGVAEHGFSAHVQVDGRSLLFDTGSGVGVVENARQLGVDLQKVDAVVLSHGHYDHCGGLSRVLEQRDAPTPVHAHPDVFCARYSVTHGRRRFVGIFHRREYLEALGAEFKPVTTFTPLGESVFLTGEVERRSDFEHPDPHLFVQSEADGTLGPDLVRDDLSLAIRTEKGIVVLLGCAHAGVVNILEHVTRHLGTDRIRAVIGGTHLAGADANRMERTMAALEAFQVERIGTCHCTGPHQEATLRARFGERFFFAQVGSRIVL